MTVFGIVSTVESKIGTAIFVAFLVFIILLHMGFEWMEHAASHAGLGPLFEKLKHELMMMGIISFVVFIYESSAGAGSSTTAIYMAFEMTHIIVLFMAVAFIGQAFFLVSYASTSGKRYLNALRTSSEKLLKRYKKMADNARESWWFHHGHSLLPAYPSFRVDIEFRIIERLFISQHKLSPEFNFANYVNALFMIYTAELAEVKPIGWLMLALLVVLNLFRVWVVDPSIEGENCSGMASDAAHRRLGGGGGGSSSAVSDACIEYIMMYAYICSVLLFLFSSIVYVMSVIYVDRIILMSLKVDKIENTEGGTRYAYKESLALMIRRDKMLAHGAMLMKSHELTGIESESSKKVPPLTLRASQLNLSVADSSPLHTGSHRDSAGVSARSARLSDRRLSARLTERKSSKGSLLQSLQNDPTVLLAKEKQKKAKVATQFIRESVASHLRDAGEAQTKSVFTVKSEKNHDLPPIREVRKHIRRSMDSIDLTGTIKGGIQALTLGYGTAKVAVQAGPPNDVLSLNRDALDGMENGNGNETGASRDLDSSVAMTCTSSPGGRLEDLEQGMVDIEAGGGAGMPKGVGGHVTDETMNPIINAPPPQDIETGGIEVLSPAPQIATAQDNTEHHNKDGSMKSIFLFHSPELFFRSVEAVLLFQCFYISMVATQLLPLTESSGHNGGWVVGFLVPIGFVFYVIQLTLNKAVLLRSVYELEREVAGKVVEDAKEEKTCIARLRESIFSLLEEEGIPESEQKDYLKEYFFRYDTKGTGEVGATDFQKILGDLSIYMSHHSFKILWQAVDYDLSGALDWDEIVSILFQNEAKIGAVESADEIPAVTDLRHAPQIMLTDRRVPVLEWEGYMKNVFNSFDEDGSSTMEIDEFEAMLDKLQVAYKKSDIPEIFGAISSADGLATFDDIWGVIFPTVSSARR